MGAGQVLSCPYPADKARLVVREMADALALDLCKSAWWPGSWYSPWATTGRAAPMAMAWTLTTDPYGCSIPKPAHGTGASALSHRLLSPYHRRRYDSLFDRIVDPRLPVRRMYLVAEQVIAEELVPTAPQPEQLDLFTDYEAREKQQAAEQETLERERQLQQAVLHIKK